MKCTGPYENQEHETAEKAAREAICIKRARDSEWQSSEKPVLISYTISNPSSKSRKVLTTTTSNMRSK